MKISQKDIPDKKPVVSKPSVQQIYGPMFPPIQNNSDVLAKLDDIARIIIEKKPPPNYPIIEKNTNHEDLVRLITGKMDEVKMALNKNKEVNVEVKRSRSGLIESLTFKSIDKNGTT